MLGNPCGKARIFLCGPHTTRAFLPRPSPRSAIRRGGFPVVAIVAPGAGTTAKFMGVKRPDVAAPIAKCDHGCFNTSTQDVCAPFDHRMTNAIRP